MSWWEALILGLAQGFGEFLPISSSGHLLLLEKLGVGVPDMAFNIAVHVATLAAVVIVMRKRIWALVRRPFQKTTLYIVLACVPTVAIAAMFKFAFPQLLEGKLLGFGFVLTACLLFASEKLKNDKTRLLTVKTSILTGVLQGIAVLPGVSRSGATISAMTLCGVPKQDAADFSFLLSIPIIIGSAALEGVELYTGAKPIVDALPLAVGMVSAFISGLAAVTLFLKLVKGRSLLPFAAYTFTLGVALSLFPLFGVNI